MMNILQDATAWVALSFIVFLVVIWIKGRKSMLGALDAKIDTIRKEIQTAETLKREAEQLLAEYERKQQQTVTEAQNIVAMAEKNAAEIRRQATSNMDEAMQRREKQLHSRLEQMKQSAVSEIQQYAADLAIKATREIVTQQLDQKAGSKLLDDSIRNISRKLH